MHKIPHDEFLQKTAETRIRKRAGLSTTVHLEQITFPNGTKERPPYRRTSIKTERGELSFYASGRFETDLEGAIESTLESLEQLLREFEMMGDDREMVPFFLEMYFEARIKFENPEENWDLSTEGLRRTASVIDGYKSKEEALMISNSISLEEIRERMSSNSH